MPKKELSALLLPCTSRRVSLNFVAHELPSLQAAPKDKIERSYLGKSYIKKPLVMDDGHIIIKKNFGGPGLGIELDDNLVENERVRS